MGINSRQKGAAAEREAAAFFCEQFGEGAARRGQQFSGSPDSPDVVAPVIPNIHLEVKRVEKFSLYPAMAQARRDCGGKIPIVMHRKNREGWVFILDATDGCDLLARAGYVVVGGED